MEYNFDAVLEVVFEELIKESSLRRGINRQHTHVDRSMTHRAIDSTNINDWMDKFHSFIQSRALSQKPSNKNQQQRINSLENELKTLKTHLEKSTEQSQLLKQKIENQRAELKILYTKSNQVSLLNTEIAKLKSQLDEKKKTTNANQECAICCEIFSEDRKRVAYGPCGHSMACVECSETMLGKTTVNIARGQKKTECPICRAEIKSNIILQGIY